MSTEKAVVTQQYLADIAEAIRTKGGTTDTLLPSQMAGAIEAIPSGGVAWEDHNGEEYDDEIGRRGTRYIVQIPRDNFGYRFGASMLLAAGSSSCTVDWGDGSEATVFNRDLPNYNTIVHTFAKAGEYLITISDDITSLQLWASQMTLANKTIDSSMTFRHLIYLGTKIRHFTFRNCYAYVGTIPPIRYFDENGVELVDWNTLIGLNFANNCYGIHGTIPRFPNCVLNCSGAFTNCYLLSGKMPKIPSACTNAANMFNGCFNLDGIWDESASDAEIMPPSVTRFDNCVANCSDAVRQHFLTTWGGTRAS